MQVLIAFLIVVFILGSRIGDRVRTHPFLLLAFCGVVAASFYRLGVVQ